MFYDSVQNNLEARTMSAGHVAALVFVIVLLVSVLVGTAFEVISKASKAAHKQHNIDNNNRRRPT